MFKNITKVYNIEIPKLKTISLLLLLVVTNSANAQNSAVSTDKNEPISSKNEKISRNELQSKIDDINDQINEKKEAKKGLKKLNEELSSIYQPFEVSSKLPLNQTEIPRLIEEFLKTKKAESYYKLYNNCFKDLGAFTNSLYDYIDQSKSVELQNLSSNINLKVREIQMDFQYDDNGKIISPLDINKIKATFSSENVVRINKQIQEIVVGFKTQVTTKISQLDEELKKLNVEKFSLLDTLENKIDTTETIFKWGFPVFISFILILYLVPLLFFKNRKTHDKEDKDGDVVIYTSIYSTGLITEIITIFLLTSTILLLGLTDKINSEILGTLIGGISGYVLGKSFKNTKTEN